MCLTYFLSEFCVSAVSRPPAGGFRTQSLRVSVDVHLPLPLSVPCHTLLVGPAGAGHVRLSSWWLWAVRASPPLHLFSCHSPDTCLSSTKRASVCLILLLPLSRQHGGHGVTGRHRLPLCLERQKPLLSRCLAEVDLSLLAVFWTGGIDTHGKQRGKR